MKKVLLVAIIIILLIIVSFWVYFNIQISSPHPVDRDWKTYTNSEYGFEFKYPNDAINIEVVNSPLNDVAIHKYDRMVIIGQQVNLTEPVLVAGRQGYEYSFVTSVNYKYNGFMVPLNDNNYLEVHESSKNPVVPASDFQKIISTFKFTK